MPSSGETFVKLLSLFFWGGEGYRRISPGQLRLGREASKMSRVESDRVSQEVIESHWTVRVALTRSVPREVTRPAKNRGKNRLMTEQHRPREAAGAAAWVSREVSDV